MSSEIKIVALVLGIAIISSGVAKVGSEWLSGISRNPEASDKMFIPAMAVLAFCELFGLVMVASLFMNL